MRSETRRAFTVVAALALTVTAQPPHAAAAGVGDAALPDLVATLLPSCVNITTTRYREVQTVHGQSVIVQEAESDQRHAYGSGFIITTDGYVVTNKHVTRNGISYAVTLADGRQFPADLVAQAVANDVAVIRIRSNEVWTPVKFGDSDQLRQGEPVIAIGNPRDYQSTVTTGIVSALNRDAGFTEFDDYIQTDAAINPGNSGGPLFNRKGEVIGVNTALYSGGSGGGSVGLGFAIPINDVEFVVRHMKDGLEATQNWQPAWLGAAVQSLTPPLAAAYGLPGPWGSIIASINDGGPAARAGLRVGDIVTSWNGKDRKDSRALMRSVVETPAGTTARLGIWRDGKTDAVEIALTGLPAGWSLPVYLGGGGVARPTIPPEAVASFGMVLAPITDTLRGRYSIGASQRGVVVTGVAIGSPAADLAINAGMVVVQVRDSAVSTPQELTDRIADEKQQKRGYVPLLLWSSTGLSWVSFALD